MAQNKMETRVLALTGTEANLLNPGTTTGGTPTYTKNLYFLVKHIRIVNKHATNAGTYKLYRGATVPAAAAGTEIMGFGRSIPVGGYDEWFPQNLRLDVADFLTGNADAVSTLTVMFVYEIGII